MKSPETKLSLLVAVFLFTFQSIFSQHIVENRRNYIKKLETNKKKTVYDRNAIVLPKEDIALTKKTTKNVFLAKRTKVRRKKRFNKNTNTTSVLAVKEQEVKREVKTVRALENSKNTIENKDVIVAVEKVEDKIEALKVHHVIEDVEDKIVEKQLEKSKLLQSNTLEKRTRIVNVNNSTIADADVENFSHGKIVTVEHLEKMLETRRFLKHRSNTVIDVHKCFIDKNDTEEEQVCQKK